MEPSHKAKLKQRIIDAFATASHEERLDTYTQMMSGIPMGEEEREEEQYSREVVNNLVETTYPEIKSQYVNSQSQYAQYVNSHEATHKSEMGETRLQSLSKGIRGSRGIGGRRRRRRSATAHKSSSSRHRRSSKKSGNKRKQRRHRRASRRSH